MYYEFDVSRLPELTNIYSVRRRTVWQIVDPDTLLIFAAEGSCSISMDNCDYTLNEGSLFIVPAHHYYIRRPIDMELCTLFYMHVSFYSSGARELLPLEAADARLRLIEHKSEQDCALTDNTCPAPSEHPYVVGVLTDLSGQRDEVLALYNEAMSQNLRSHLDYRTVESICAVRLLLLAASAAEKELNIDYHSSIPFPDSKHKLNKVFAYIRLHSKEAISLDDLCSICNFSKQHLIRVFTAEFGMTPKAYILKYKVNTAKEMFFRNPHLSVKEVADEMGFSDQHYFTRLFTKVAGISPSAYKTHLLTFDPAKQ